MTKIRDIINRELIARVNNFKYRQESAIKGIDTNKLTDQNISGEHKTVFNFDYGLDTLVYVTVNGVMQTEGDNYSIDESGNRIVFNGIILDGRTVAVGYSNVPRVNVDPNNHPIIDFFSVVPSGGGAGILTFDFKLAPLAGRNIFWSIYRAGEDEVLLNTNGNPMSGKGIDPGSVIMTWELTQEEFAGNPSRDLDFTLIITYDMMEDDELVDGKILETLTYVMDQPLPLALDVNVVPEGTIMNPVDGQIHDISYLVEAGEYVRYKWRVVDIQKDIVMASGSVSDGSDVAGSFQVIHNFDVNSVSIPYTLFVIADGMSNETSTTGTIEVGITTVNDLTEVFLINATAFTPISFTYVMSKLPSITVIDNNGELVSAEAAFTGTHEITLTFNIDFVGQLILN